MQTTARATLSLPAQQVGLKSRTRVFTCHLFLLPTGVHALHYYDSALPARYQESFPQPRQVRLSSNGQNHRFARPADATQIRSANANRMSTFFRSPSASSPAAERPDALSPEESPQITTRSARRARHAGGDRVGELEAENAQLRAEIDRLKTQKRPVRRSNSMTGRPKRTAEKKRRHLLRDSIMHTVEEDAEGDGGSQVRITRNKISRQASIGTATVLKQMPSTPRPAGFSLELPTRVVAVFREPNRVEHTEYLGSSQFADDILNLARQAGRRFEREPRVLQLESPAYVFGDTHGNLEDLHFFSDHIWKLGISLTAGQLVFLGDYVDRGQSSLEVVAYLLALKCLEPQKVWMLRGNHETRDVNGWEEHYGDRSFLWQCKHRFGDELGPVVWEGVNACFDRLPLCAVIDEEIVCLHGGMPRRPPPGPRPFCADADSKTRLELLNMVPSVITINPPDNSIDADLQQMASECLWSDPAVEEQEPDLNEEGYGESLRGGGTVCFGHAAIKGFLEETGCAFIVRAHEAHAHGVSLSKGAKVFTVFSTSKDHHQGRQASCGCILVDVEKIQVINKSPSYRNHFVHKRNSMSLIGIPQDEISKRKLVGLVVDDDDDDDDGVEYLDDSEDDEDIFGAA